MISLFEEQMSAPTRIESGGIPQRKKRPPSADKNNLKLARGRARGTTRRKLLKGQSS